MCVVCVIQSGVIELAVCRMCVRVCACGGCEFEFYVVVLLIFVLVVLLLRRVCVSCLLWYGMLWYEGLKFQIFYFI